MSDTVEFNLFMDLWELLTEDEHASIWEYLTSDSLRKSPKCSVIDFLPTVRAQLSKGENSTIETVVADLVKVVGECDG